MKNISIADIKNNKEVKLFLFVWLVFSIMTTFSFYYQIESLNHIDVPTHLFAGLVITAFMFHFIEDQNAKKIFLFAMVPFLLWEAIEIFMTMLFNDGFLFRLFHETWKNRFQDVVMDTIGFIGFIWVKK